VIQFLHVTHTYDGGFRGVQDVTFRIDQGEFVFLTGQSGAGKTTVLKHVYMEEFPDPQRGGRVLVTFTNGRVFDSTRATRSAVQDLRRHVGTVFQDFRLLNDRDVWENVAFPLRVAGFGGRHLKERVDTVLEQVGVAHKRRNHPRELSGGEQQRVSIARAVAPEPYIVLADEPTGNLDPENAAGVLELFRSLHSRGTTVVMATHDQELMRRWPMRRIVLENGRLLHREFA
jgi:cell division transport system ATP-binding protein